jgi:hypothetical protein
MYARKYYIIFKNRFQNDIYRCDIYQKDFVGEDTSLTGAETPCVLTSDGGDTDILTPIKTHSLTVSFITDSLSIEDFYSDDDEEYRVDHYFQSDSGGGGSEQLLFSGFLVQEDVSEDVTDRKHLITLKFTDNLALLKNVKWNEVAYFDNFPYFHQLDLFEYVAFILNKTNLYNLDSVIDQNLTLRIFDNLFENTTTDRSDDATNDPFIETILHSGMFQENDGTWKDCYTVLESILTAFNACLFQADGCWNIIRIPEYKLFTDGAIPGTSYHFDGIQEVNAITLDPLATIDRGGEIEPINEDQLKTIQRPVKYVKNTFNYNQPEFIQQSKLEIPEGATPASTHTVDGIRYDDYSLATYFPDWVQRDGDTSYLENATDTNLTPEEEKERYIVVPSSDDTPKGVQFNPVPISAGDVIDFSANIKTLADTGDATAFWVRCLLITDSGDFYTLVRVELVVSGITYGDVRWFGPFDATEWDTTQTVSTVVGSVPAYFYFGYNDPTSTWQQISTDLDIQQGVKQWRAPVDGMLLIQMNGANMPDTSHKDMCFKDVHLGIRNFINQSKLITGQTHTDTGTSTIKAIEENDIDIDDSPRNTIAGTLLSDTISTFEYTDVNTSEVTGIGDIYFTRTRLWHRAELNEALKLGNIITQERLELKFKSRLQIEGTFKNLRYDTNKFISLLSLLRFGWLTDKNFVFASLTVDYMACTFNGKLVEIWNESDVENTSVFVSGVKEEELGITTGLVEYDTITNFGGAETYIDTTDSNSKFTYINAFNTTVRLSVIFFVPISGSGTATFTILKNGGVIATETLDAIEVFGHISFDLTESVTAGDYFQVNIDTGGADVDIQSGSINITVNDAMSMVLFPYLFNYIYKTE